MRIREYLNVNTLNKKTMQSAYARYLGLKNGQYPNMLSPLTPGAHHELNYLDI